MSIKQIGVKLLALLVLGFSASTWSATPDFPDALIYKGKPIDPLCFYEAGDTNHTANLEKCGLHSQSERTITGENTTLTDQGFFGYDYNWKVDKTSDTEGYSYYKPFGNLGQSVVIETSNNSGGTGQFSSISVITRDKHKIKVNPYNGGDRCNNGIVSVKRDEKETGPVLQYSVNITAYDFLTLAKDNHYKLEPYDDLDSCAACCAATAVFERSLDKNFDNEKFIHVDLKAYPKEGDDAGDSGPKYQVCFDKVLEGYNKQYKGILDPKALLDFTKAFNKQCVDGKS